MTQFRSLMITEKRNGFSATLITQILGMFSSEISFAVRLYRQTLIRGFQVQVAKGNLAIEHIAIYYVGKRKNGNSYVKKLELTDKGMFTDPWPGGFFEEDYKLTKELLKHQ